MSLLLSSLPNINGVDLLKNECSATSSVTLINTDIKGIFFYLLPLSLFNDILKILK